MLLTDDVDLRPYLALCSAQQQNLEQQLELLRDGDRAGAARCSADQHRIHAAANASLALALGLKVSRRSATICELIAGRFSYAPCVSVGGASLIDHPVTLTWNARATGGTNAAILSVDRGGAE